VTGAHPDHVEVLSEDDEEDEQQMRPHNKPIESAKSLSVPAAQREAVAYENAAAASRLRKGQPDVHVDTVGLAPEPEPSAPLEKGRVGQSGMVRYSEETDMAVDRLFKSEQDFYTGGSPSIIPFSRPIGVGKECPACGTGMSKSLTACPACGHGATAPQVVRIESAPRTDMAKSRPGLLRPRKVQDLKIDD
jgi:hypothetical protein